MADGFWQNGWQAQRRPTVYASCEHCVPDQAALQGVHHLTSTHANHCKQSSDVFSLGKIDAKFSLRYYLALMKVGYYGSMKTVKNN